MTDTRTPAQKVIAEAMRKKNIEIEKCQKALKIFEGDGALKDKIIELQLIKMMLIQLMIDVHKAEMEAAR